MHEESYLHCIKMSLKFVQYCNVANVVLISIREADNLFRQEQLICMQGGQSLGLGCSPHSLYFQCKCRSASESGVILCKGMKCKLETNGRFIELVPRCLNAFYLNKSP